MSDSPLTRAINGIRHQIKSVASQTKFLTDVVARGEHEQGPDEDQGEVVANLKITYRHLEDASMRLGKAIQAHDGGVSVYDKATTVGALDNPPRMFDALRPRSSDNHASNVASGQNTGASQEAGGLMSVDDNN